VVVENVRRGLRKAGALGVPGGNPIGRWRGTQRRSVESTGTAFERDMTERNENVKSVLRSQALGTERPVPFPVPEKAGGTGRTVTGDTLGVTLRHADFNSIAE
jgi:hypothetical protein